MSVVTDYYKSADSERLSVLEGLWEFAKSLEPEAEEGLSYGLPALKLYGRPLIGFSISKEHLSVYPFSPKIVTAVRKDLSGFESSRGVIRFSEDNVIPKEIIEVMVQLRKEQLSR